MQERIIQLEGHYDELSRRMTGVESKMDQVISILSDQKAKQLPPITTVLATAALTAGLITSIIGGFFFLVDARVGAAVQSSNNFVAQMTDRGGIWVDLAQIKQRLVDLEQFNEEKKNGAHSARPVSVKDSTAKRQSP